MSRISKISGEPNSTYIFGKWQDTAKLAKQGLVRVTQRIRWGALTPFPHTTAATTEGVRIGSNPMCTCPDKAQKTSLLAPEAQQVFQSGKSAVRVSTLLHKYPTQRTIALFQLSNDRTSHRYIVWHFAQSMIQTDLPYIQVTLPLMMKDKATFRKQVSGSIPNRADPIQSVQCVSKSAFPGMPTRVCSGDDSTPVDHGLSRKIELSFLDEHV